MDKELLNEKKSCAISLSDMEIFVFPDLMYALLLANIMSPRLWTWRDDPWFAKTQGSKNLYRRAQRVKQYIIEHYVFNLDLETWGLTSKHRELARFSDMIDEYALKRSNALFGYEGDKYYFDMDIRAHFGLDHYDEDIIPYWKTETIEAMDAFQLKTNYQTGAGECVSLSALYAAALFVVAGIPLRDIFLMLTPLHSQNFAMVGDGFLTNNRRLVTKNMWFNGTALTAKARRALENERVVMVCHETGCIHTVFHDATIDRNEYTRFAEKLRMFLRTDLEEDILANFLRHEGQFQHCFQVRWPLHGVDHYIGAERVFRYEHNNPNRFDERTREKLMNEIDAEEFHTCRMPKRIVLNDLEDYVREHNLSLCTRSHIGQLKKAFASECLDSEIAIESLLAFCLIEPRLPNADEKRFVDGQEPLGVTPDMSREAIIDQLDSIRDGNTTADLAFYAYRDLRRTEPTPFVYAAIGRNPVSIEGLREVDTWEVFSHVGDLDNESIYDGPGRLAQPDEVWNYQRGDGVEKALLLANVLHHRLPDQEITIEISPTMAVVKIDSEEFTFASHKQIEQQTWAIPGGEACS